MNCRPIYLQKKTCELYFRNGKFVWLKLSFVTLHFVWVVKIERTTPSSTPLNINKISPAFHTSTNWHELKSSLGDYTTENQRRGVGSAKLYASANTLGNGKYKFLKFPLNSFDFVAKLLSKASGSEAGGGSPHYSKSKKSSLIIYRKICCSYSFDIHTMMSAFGAHGPIFPFKLGMKVENELKPD